MRLRRNTTAAADGEEVPPVPKGPETSAPAEASVGTDRKEGAVPSRGGDESTEASGRELPDQGTEPVRASAVERPSALLLEGRFAEAAQLFEDAVGADPDNLDALLGLGASLRGLGRYEAAERELKRALRLAPNVADVRYQLGLTLYRRGVYPAAIAELRQASATAPDYAPAHFVLGEALNKMGEVDAAIDALEAAVRLQPDHGKAYYALGIAYDRKGQPDRAAEMYRRSRELAGR